MAEVRVKLSFSVVFLMSEFNDIDYYVLIFQLNIPHRVIIKQEGI